MVNPLATVWFYNSDSGSVISETALGDTIQSHLPGWHGPFGTKQEALDYYTDNKAANPKWKAPAGLASAVKNTVAAAVNSANPLGALFQAAIWIRVAEVAAGLILLGIGLNAMLKGRPLSAVTSAAGAAGKVAMF